MHKPILAILTDNFHNSTYQYKTRNFSLTVNLARETSNSKFSVKTVMSSMTFDTYTSVLL